VYQGRKQVYQEQAKVNMKNWKKEIVKLQKYELVPYVEKLLKKQEDAVILTLVREMERQRSIPKEVTVTTKLSDIINKS